VCVNVSVFYCVSVCVCMYAFGVFVCVIVYKSACVRVHGNVCLRLHVCVCVCDCVRVCVLKSA